MRNPTGFLQWVSQNPKDTGLDGESRPSSWAGKCVALVRRAGGFPITNTAPTAALARELTIRNGHAMVLEQEVPRGWFVYFDGPTKEGHVGMATGDGGFCSATSFLPGSVGVMPVADYARKRGVTYRGASPFFIDLRLESDPSPTPQQNKDTDMRIIYNTDNSNDDTRRALVGELSFQTITAGQSTREGKLWGATVNFTQGEWDNCLLLVNARRSALGLPVIAGGASSGLSAAEHARLFEIPTAEENATAARSAIVK